MSKDELPTWSICEVCHEKMARESSDSQVIYRCHSDDHETTVTVTASVEIELWEEADE